MWQADYQPGALKPSVPAALQLRLLLVASADRLAGATFRALALLHEKVIRQIGRRLTCCLAKRCNQVRSLRTALRQIPSEGQAVQPTTQVRQRSCRSKQFCAVLQHTSHTYTQSSERDT